MRRVVSYTFLWLWSCIVADGQSIKSTEDLSFLIGEWEVNRVYSPEGESRTLRGSLSCVWTMDSTFIKCQYVMKRPDKIPGLDVVYFNYNPIYEKYEHLWLSSTWPIKVLMHGDLENTAGQNILNSSAQFPIQNQVTEYVKGSLSFSESVIKRKTHIRTSADKDSKWTLHMIETATIKE